MTDGGVLILAPSTLSQRRYRRRAHPTFDKQGHISGPRGHFLGIAVPSC